MTINEKSRVQFFLWAILLIGIALRFYQLDDWSLTNDELSAIFRTKYDSVFDLLKSYLSQPDGHPPLVQLFIYYWTTIIGPNQTLLRFPFIILGIVCIPLSYRVFRMWFSDITAVYVAAGIGLLQYPILYSQLARPYSIGLLFMLLYTYYWTKLVFLNRYNLKTYILYIIIGICSLYIHYFLTLNILILAVLGFFLIKKYRRKTYLILNAVVGLAFLPYIKIFLIQLSIGGVGNWLPKPENDFFLTYLYYCFNSHWVIIVFLLAIILSGILSFQNKFNKNNWILLALIFLPYIIGHLYSAKINPVIQYSTLLFSFPFLLAFIFSFIEDKTFKGLYGITLIVFIGVTTLTSFKTWEQYHLHPFGDFKGAANHLHNWAQELPNEKTDLLINTTHLNYYKYYLDQLDCRHTFLKTSVTSEKDLGELSKYFSKQKKEHLIFSWSAANNYYELKELIRYYFPKIHRLKGNYNYEVIHFVKGEPQPKTVDYEIGFESPSNFWNFDPNSLDSSEFRSRKHALLVNVKQEYPVSLKDIESENFHPKEANVITFLVHFKSNQPVEPILAISVDNELGNQLWRGISLKEFNNVGEWSVGLVSIYLEQPMAPNDKIKAYVWNKNKETFWLDDLSFYAHTDSKYYLKK